MPRAAIHTEVLIDRPPEEVWRVLTDFPAHGDWDPLLASLEGAPAVGETLKVRFRSGMTFRPRVTVCDGRVLEWLGRLLLSGLFDGRHRFELRAEESGTRLVHSEAFSGLLVPLFRGILIKTEQAFRAFNEAIKRRVEQGA